MSAPSPLFLSYSHNDVAAADALRQLLIDQGLEVFKDDASLRSGDRWLQRLQDAIVSCGAFIVLVGRDGVQRWVGAEVEAALNRHLSPQGDGAFRLPIHPVLLGDIGPEAMPPFLALFQAERWAPGAPLPEGLRDALTRGLSRLDSRVRFEGCPFLGLGAFQRQHAELFFGRRSETLQALAGLGDQQQSAPEQLQGGHDQGYHRWLQIEGNSGSGKSSLVHAGLLPMVERGALWSRTGCAHWCILPPMMPGKDPVSRLAEALEHGLKADPQQRDTLERSRRLASDERALAFAIRDVKQAGSAFLLVIDQFEELFTLADEVQRKTFDALLAHSLQDAECPLFVVSTVRADFLDRMEQLPRLSALYNQRCKRYLLPTITPEGLREAIELPARLAGLDVTEVCNAMLVEARDEPGALPLVENALLQLWQLREGAKLSGAVYRQRNGLAGMLSAGADALLERIERALPKRGRVAALELLLALTRVNPDGRHTRQRIRRDDAVQAAGNGRVDIGERVLQMLSGQRPDDLPSGAHVGSLRLVTTSVEGEGDGQRVYVDLIHETLLRARGGTAGAAPQAYWPTLYTFIENNRDRDVLRQRLELQVERWKRGRQGLRWARLAGWAELLAYRRLRPAPRSVEWQFLARSRRVVLVEGLVLILMAATLLQSAWWATVNNLPFQYILIQPLWYLGWAPEPETVPIPPGRFTLGCLVGRDVDAGESCGERMLPATQVDVSQSCAMGRYTVTFLQYDHYVWANGGKGKAPKSYAADAGFGRFDRPVINVSWNDAKAYARWLSRHTGSHYRLPSEAEWEYAARGGRQARHPWGDDLPSGKANCADCGDAFSFTSTAPVGSYPPNAFGLFDMAGNVWQWVEDQAGGDDAARVMRGGSWYDDATRLGAAYRLGFNPDGRHAFVGFRVCRGSSIEPKVTRALGAGPLNAEPLEGGAQSPKVDQSQSLADARALTLAQVGAVRQAPRVERAAPPD